MAMADRSGDDPGKNAPVLRKERAEAVFQSVNPFSSIPVLPFLNSDSTFFRIRLTDADSPVPSDDPESHSECGTLPVFGFPAHRSLPLNVHNFQTVDPS